MVSLNKLISGKKHLLRFFNWLLSFVILTKRDWKQNRTITKKTLSFRAYNINKINIECLSQNIDEQKNHPWGHQNSHWYSVGESTINKMPTVIVCNYLTL